LIQATRRFKGRLSWRPFSLIPFQFSLALMGFFAIGVQNPLDAMVRVRSIPTQACKSGPFPSAAMIGASMAVGQWGMQLAASRSVARRGTGSSKRVDHLNAASHLCRPRF
jgi:hypothetical protein